MESNSAELPQTAGLDLAQDLTATAPFPEQNANMPAFAECRICQLSSDIKEMLSPCKCAGSMKYVHIECLEAWRRRSPTNAVRCGVCQTPYSNLRVPPAGLAGALYVASRLRLLFHHELWRGAGDTHATLLELVTEATPGFCVLRLIVWSMLMCVSVMQARFLLLVVTIVHEAIIGMDQAIDPLILPPLILNQIYEVFPAVAGFGRMGISNATAEVISELMSGPSVIEINSHTLRIWETIAQLCDFDALCRPPETLDDLVLGVFILLMNGHLLKQRAPGSPALEALLRVPSPFADVSLLLEFLVPQPDYASAFLVLILPMSAYFGRWILAKFHVLPMTAFPIHEHAALHVVLAMLTLGAMVALSSLADYITEDFARWYAAYTLEPRHALQRQEGEARDVSARIAAAAAAQTAPAASTVDATDTAARGMVAEAVQTVEMIEAPESQPLATVANNADNHAVVTEALLQYELDGKGKMEGNPEHAKQPLEVEHTEAPGMCKEHEERLQMPEDESQTELAAKPEAQQMLLDKVKKLESEQQGTAAMSNEHLEQTCAEQDKRRKMQEETQGASQDSEKQWCLLTEAHNTHAFDGLASSSPQQVLCPLARATSPSQPGPRAHGKELHQPQ